MRNHFAISLALITLVNFTSVQAAEFATAKDAEALVGKAISHIKTDGKEKSYADFTGKKAGWADRDLYVVVYDLTGKVLAHGQNAKQVGMDLIGITDADGKEFVKERVDLAKSKGKFWQDYKFTDPVSKKILPKSMYCEKLDDTVVCSGIYKR
jgi:signal transduction histidine kinase